tara:strand:- start:43 stop:261 length:219 start_codon:yes stop_codon:yes gene_type:complete
MTNQPKFKVTEASSGITDNENKRYEIRQLVTTGWELDDDNDTNLTREQCDDKLRQYINDGVPPNRLQVKRIS